MPCRSINMFGFFKKSPKPEVELQPVRVVRRRRRQRPVQPKRVQLSPEAAKLMAMALRSMIHS